MSASIPQLTMFPLYPGGPKVRYNSTINANSSFYLPATRFTPQYGINVPGAVNRTAYSLDGGSTLRRSEGASLSDQPLGFDAAVLGGLKKTAVPPVAPVIPNLYQQAARLLSVSDLRMSELLAQPSFNLSGLGPGAGLGLNVKTDGAGGIDTVSLSTSARGLNPSPSPFDPGFGGLKRAEITTGATFKTGLDAGLAGVHTVNPANARKPFANSAAQAPLPFGQIQQPISGLTPLTNLLQADLNDIDFDALAINPVVQRLNQLQPANAGLPVTGYDSMMGLLEARQLAASQAKLDVVPSEQFRRSVASLVSGASRQGDSYSAVMKPVSLDGRLPIVPTLPGSSQGVGHSGAGMAQDSFNLKGELSSAADRKGSGGYIPFQMQSNAQGGFSGGGAGNPFALAGGSANQSNQQQQQRRRLPAFVA